MEIIESIKQALELTKKREYKKAERIYLSLLKENPDNASVLSFLGLFYYNIKFYKKAEKYLDKSYKLCPSDTLIFYIGMTKFNLGKLKTAIPYLELALKTNDSIELYKALLTSCSDYGEYKKGYNYAKQAHKKYPFDRDILTEFAYLALKQGQFEECQKYSLKLLKIDPKTTGAWHNLGLLNEILYDDENKARECYRKMLKCGDKEGGYLDLAISYGKDPKFRKKTYYYLKKLEKLNPNASGLKFSFASYYLSNRQFKKGYQYYIQPEFAFAEMADWFNKFKNKWQGERKCQNQELLIFGDQGLGDQIQNIRYIPYLARRFKKIKIVITKSLIDLFKYSYKNYDNISFYEKTDSLPKYDKSTFLTFTPYYLDMNFNNIPYRNQYLFAEDNKINEYKTKYFKTEKYKIGICWESGASGLREQIHRILNVNLFENIINMDKASVYSFQVNPSMDNYKNYPNLIELGSSFKDFSDTAAALKNLDIMITVDTSVAHLSGALGVKTILILPYCPDWRWFDNTEKTEWYESIRIFKQCQNESWESVFERIEAYLNNSV